MVVAAAGAGDWFMNPRSGEPAGHEVFVMALATGGADHSILEHSDVGAPMRLRQDGMLIIKIELVAAGMQRVSEPRCP